MIVKYSFCFIGLLVVFGACKNNEQEIAILSINKSLEQSTINLRQATTTMYRAMDERLSDPKTAEYAKIWQPKAESIRLICEGAFNYIESIKKVSISQSTASDLYKKLKNYQIEMNAVDSEMSYQLKKYLNPITHPFDIMRHPSTDFFNTFFNNEHKIPSETVLNTFQNNILITENQTVTFCFSKSAFHGCILRFEKFGALVGQNTNHLKAGETLELIAGVGSFSIAAAPQISINKKNIEIIDGRANYKLKASTEIGKHSVPVKISYVDQNGEHQIFTTEVEYTVDE